MNRWSSSVWSYLLYNSMLSLWLWAINQLGVCLPPYSSKFCSWGVVGTARCVVEGRELHWVFTGFSVSDGTEHVLNQARLRGTERKSGLWSFWHPQKICAWESPLFPINTHLWHKTAVLSGMCAVWFCPMTSKFVFVDKFVDRAQLVRKWVGLISHLFRSVI